MKKKLAQETMNNFYKFPSTPYLIASIDQDLRFDKIMDIEERNLLLSHEISIEEKVDGANLGISFDKDGSFVLQNRGSYITSPFLGQWKHLDTWLKNKENDLFYLLGFRYILFGEWCYAVHSLKYHKLPDWFIAFDLFDRDEKKYLSVNDRDQFLESLQITTVPRLGKGKFTLNQLNELMKKKSSYSDQIVEGIYLRWDEGKWLKKRAKMVRYGFVQNIKEHWTSKPLETNRLEYWN